MSFKRLFAQSLAAAPERLHAAAHSHHLWPDAAFEGHAAAAADAARLADHKWDAVFGEILPAARAEAARELHLSPRGETVVFAPNTHDFITRLQSCFPRARRMHVLTTDGEFHSLSRQLSRWEEAGWAEATRVPCAPRESFDERFLTAAADGAFDWVFLSHVFFGSGAVFGGLADLCEVLAGRPDWLIIDGYHGFMAVETDLSAVADRAFYLAGGYKYAMSGEGACFLHAPPHQGPRPVDTGWFAAFEALEAPPDGSVSYADTAARFAGATFDPSGLYRFVAVRRMLAREGLTTGRVSAHVGALLDQFAEAARTGRAGRLADAEALTPRAAHGARARFLAFRHPGAGAWRRRLADGGVVADVRGDVIRFGLGLYHDADDVERLAQACAGACD